MIVKIKVNTKNCNVLPFIISFPVHEVICTIHTLPPHILFELSNCLPAITSGVITTTFVAVSVVGL